MSPLNRSLGRRPLRLRALVAGLMLIGVAAAIAPTAAAARRERPSESVCPAPPFGAARCESRVITHTSATPLAQTSPTGYGPADFHGAYALPATAPSGQTIAIVDAYNSPTIESDLNAYSSQYGLPACTTANACFTKVNQSGVEGSYPQANAGWALEIALDVETAHAICPNCKILLVEASSNSFADLTTAESTAAALGATEISNSWSGVEYSDETSDASFNHPGIAITASAGDSGYGAAYPAGSPNVVAVGGTTLNQSGGDYGSETVWGGTGSGCSAYESAQSWQTSDPKWAQTGCGAKRGIADVAADADPNTGASVYDTTRYQGQSGWFTVGGTSLSAPLIAGVYALAGGSSATYPAAVPYSHQTDSPTSLHDVTTGSNGSCSTTMCAGAAGYDGPTGVGTPQGVAAFEGGSSGGSPPIVSTDPATSITETSATLNGTVNPKGQATTYHFEWGTTTSYGQATANQSAGSGTVAVAASANLAGLSPGTTYHYRLVATNDSGTNHGSDGTLTATSSPHAAPSIMGSTPASPSNNDNPNIKGSAEAGSTVKLYTTSDCSGSPTAIDSAANFAAPGIAVTVPDNQTTSFHATATDAAGNTSACSTGFDYTEDSRVPNAPSITGSTPASPSNNDNPNIEGSAEAGSTVKLYTSSGCMGAHTDDSAANFAAPGIAVTASDDATTTFYATATDAAGNTSECSDPFDYAEDSTPPQTTIDSGPSGATNDPTPTFEFSASESGASFECRVDSGSFASCGSPLTTAALTDDQHTFDVRATDEAGNTGTPASRTFTVDTQAPDAPSISRSTPASPSNNDNPNIKGSAEAGSTVKLYTTSDCSGSPTAIDSAANFAAPGIAVTVPDNQTTSFHATATDAAGNTSACSTGFDYTEDSTPPAGPSNSFTIGKVKKNKVEVTVPGAGAIAVNDAHAANKKLLLKPSSASAGGAGSYKVTLKPTKRAKKKLKHKLKLKVKAAVTFTPTGGTANTEDKVLKLKK